MTHTCHAIGCPTPVRPTLLFCRHHWALCPVPRRMAVVRTYRPGQCRDRRITGPYYLAQREAVAAVAVAEGRWNEREVERMRPRWMQAAARLAAPREVA